MMSGHLFLYHLLSLAENILTMSKSLDILPYQLSVQFYTWKTRILLALSHLLFGTLGFYKASLLLYLPQTVFVGGYTVFMLSVRPSERTNEQKCVRNVLFS